jgi:hypothetical protein
VGLPKAAAESFAARQIHESDYVGNLIFRRFLGNLLPGFATIHQLGLTVFQIAERLPSEEWVNDPPTIPETLLRDIARALTNFYINVAAR